MSSPRKDKTVYVLGAGFSAGAGLPVQSRILANILSKLGYSFSGILASEAEIDFQKSLDGKIEQIENFILRSFPESDQLLEDIFTLLDQTIDSNGHFRGLTGQDLQALRKTWIEVIVGYFHALSAGYLKEGNNVCQRFVSALLKQRIAEGQQSDPISVISLNWDSIIEDALYDVLNTIGSKGKADIDYCVYTTPLGDSTHTPSTKQKASGLFNLKLLKIHGSTTWLRCPNSNHIYTGLGSSKNPYELYVRPQRSPFIEEICPDSEAENGAPLLEPFIITPTYTKVFDQPHIQTTWHNAYVELREATKIVFIGYSLPEADYHFRTLLRRSIRDETEIEVILHENDGPIVTDPVYSDDDIEPEGSDLRKPTHSETFLRYRKLFGQKRIDNTTRFEGMESYIDELLPEEDYPEALQYLREQLSNHRTYRELLALDGPTHFSPTDTPT